MVSHERDRSSDNESDGDDFDDISRGKMEMQSLRM